MDDAAKRLSPDRDAVSTGDKCTYCGDPVAREDAFGFSRPDLDLHGIWCGPAKRYIWTTDETFCSMLCLFWWIRAEYMRIQAKEVW